MDFFQQQDIARRNTRGLVLVFCLAVLALIVLTNAVVAGFLFFADDYNVYSGSRGGLQAFLSSFSWQRFSGIGIAVTAVVALVVTPGRSVSSHALFPGRATYMNCLKACP